MVSVLLHNQNQIAVHDERRRSCKRQTKKEKWICSPHFLDALIAAAGRYITPNGSDVRHNRRLNE